MAQNDILVSYKSAILSVTFVVIVRNCSTFIIYNNFIKKTTMHAVLRHKHVQDSAIYVY